MFEHHIKHDGRPEKNWLLITTESDQAIYLKNKEDVERAKKTGGKIQMALNSMRDRIYDIAYLDTPFDGYVYEVGCVLKGEHWKNSALSRSYANWIICGRFSALELARERVRELGEMTDEQIAEKYDGYGFLNRVEK